MAAKPKAGVTGSEGVRPPEAVGPKYITEAQLDDKLSGFLDKVAELVKKPDAPETPHETAVRKAGPAPMQSNPEWEEKAREILGDALDHTEYVYLKTGGVLFALVIKNDKSNAPAAYLERTGQDRRSKEIGQEGTAGVEAWCLLVSANLKKAR